MRGIYAIVDVSSALSRGVDPLAHAEALVEAKPCALQLRAKELPPREFLGLLRALVPVCRRAGVPLVANDRVDLAVLAGCDLVHVGQDDISIAQARRFAPCLGIGVSTHSLDQLARALEARPTYVAYGPVFQTASKAKADPVVGLEGLEAASRLAASAGVPLVAIGGISVERAIDVGRRADAAALIAGLYTATPRDRAAVVANARAYAEAFDRGRRDPVVGPSDRGQGADGAAEARSAGAAPALA